MRPGLHYHRLAHLFGVRAAADFEVDVGRGDVQFLEELLAHAHIVVLPGMDKNMLNFRIRLKRPAERRDLHEIRPRPNNGYDFHCMDSW